MKVGSSPLLELELVDAVDELEDDAAAAGVAEYIE
jgi:hypothetical protein